ncbi:hypothetical protein ElyMa_000355300 [Elysia marginata]|uniref:Uncharacterized protein n=1 Tax=Elysia marginata TaxID=1093978 RepID=A0AAV4FDP5_9GAST|nr:hypothetical protein ElyMa_000355300 [Elysia marginata]
MILIQETNFVKETPFQLNGFRPIRKERKAARNTLNADEDMCLVSEEHRVCTPSVLMKIIMCFVSEEHKETNFVKETPFQLNGFRPIRTERKTARNILNADEDMCLVSEEHRVCTPSVLMKIIMCFVSEEHKVSTPSMLMKTYVL